LIDSLIVFVRDLMKNIHWSFLVARAVNEK